LKQPKLFLLLSALLLVAALMLLFTNGQKRSVDDEAATLTNKQHEESAPRPQIVTESQDLPVRMRQPTAAEGESNRIAILDQIFEAKNDNDPRIDTAFNHLTPGEKRALESKYLNYKKEALNERGTIIFLLGKNVQESGVR
jgi:preprotein translocase subunit SecF